MSENEGDLPLEIRALGRALAFDGTSSISTCENSKSIESCETELTSARHGSELLEKPEIMSPLSVPTRKRLSRILVEHKKRALAELTFDAISGKGDPHSLCNDEFAAAITCRRAIAVDTQALREQVFPIYRCGRIVSGESLTAVNAAQEITLKKENPGGAALLIPQGLSFAEEKRSIADRLSEEMAQLRKLEEKN